MATANTDPGAVIENGTPLTRNRWFDGKLLRADDLARDQDYHRTALRLGNQAGGYGIVRGLEVALDSAELVLQPGLAVTPYGELLLLNGELRVAVEDLLGGGSAAALRLSEAGSGKFQQCVMVEATADPAPVTMPAEGLRVYRLTLELSQAQCGFEDVVGNLCERACVSERQRPYQVEGVRLRAKLLPLTLPALPGFEPGARHLRSRVASVLFAGEDTAAAPLPDNGGRLQSPLWCTGTAFIDDRVVTLGYLVRQSGMSDFVELWSGRRERMHSQAQGYWQRRTRMRPFADFIAQVAQFQCQLARSLDPASAPAPGGDETDCDAIRSMVAALKAQIDAQTPAPAPGEVAARPSEGVIPSSVELVGHSISPKLMQQLSQFSRIVAPLLLKRQDRLLLDRGLVELPPAGFLPVHGDATLQTQVQNLVGPGVQLRFCTAPLDAIGQMFQEAQHSARTGLTSGLADPAHRPMLQVIVPDGEWQLGMAPGIEVSVYTNPAEAVFDILVQDKHGAAGLTRDTPNKVVTARGVGRISSVAPGQLSIGLLGEPISAPTGSDDDLLAAEWLECLISGDPFLARPGEALDVGLELSMLGVEPLPGTSRGAEMHVESATLTLDAKPNEEPSMRAAIETLTGVSGGEIRQATLSGLVRWKRHTHVDQGSDDPNAEERRDFRFQVFLQRAAEPSGLRWLALRNLEDQEGDKAGQVLVLDLRAPNANGERLLEARVASFRSTKAGKVVVVDIERIPLARFRFDPQALTTGASPRTRAETGLALMDKQMADITPDAASRQRLFGTPASSANLRGPHDWVLFRRPVEAQCAAPAPPPTAPSPEKTTTYRAGVMRILPGASDTARKQALEDLRQGKLPDGSGTRLESAGTVTYVGGALQADATDTYLTAQFGQVGFADPCKLVGVFSVDAGAAPLMLDRARRLGKRLGAEPQDAIVWPQPPHAFQNADGLMIFAVERSVAPAPPLIRGHTVWLYTNAARDKLNLDAEALMTALATTGQPVLDGLRTAGARQVLFPVQFNWGPGGNGPMSIDGNLLAELMTEVAWPGNLYRDPPTLFSLDAASASTDDHKRTKEEAQFLMVQAIEGSTAPPPRVNTGTLTATLGLIDGTQVLTVVLVNQ